MAAGVKPEAGEEQNTAHHGTRHITTHLGNGSHVGSHVKSMKAYDIHDSNTMQVARCCKKENIILHTCLDLQTQVDVLYFSKILEFIASAAARLRGTLPQSAHKL
jgi:hypothetical protein